LSDGAAVTSASELVEQLNRDRKVFYEEMTAFEERKRQLAELECHLNKQVCVIRAIVEFIIP